jgi:hypothetical protein
MRKKGAALRDALEESAQADLAPPPSSTVAQCAGVPPARHAPALPTPAARGGTERPPLSPSRAANVGRPGQLPLGENPVGRSPKVTK